MSADSGSPKQLSRSDIQALAKDPGAIDEARRNGQLDELLAGRDPGQVCPHCGRHPMADQPNTPDGAA